MQLNKSSGFYLLVIVIIGLALRLYTLDSYSTWHDERLSVNSANSLINLKLGDSFTLREIKNHDHLLHVFESNLSVDASNGILYASLLHFWKDFFGNSDFSVRFLSVLIGLLVIVLIYYLTLQLTDNKSSSIIATFIAAIHPFFIHYSQEARSYNLCLLFTLTATYLFFKIIAGKGYSFKWCLMYAVIISAALLSHFFALYILISHVLILFITKTNVRWKSILTVCIITFILLMPWVLTYGIEGIDLINKRNLEYANLSGANPDHSFYMKTGIYSIAAGWFQNIINFSGNYLSLLGVQIKYNVFSLMFIGIIFYPIINIYKIKNQALITNLLILTFSSLVFATALAIKSKHIISFQVNYALFSIPYFIILTAIAINNLKTVANKTIKRLVKCSYVIQCIIICFSVGLIYSGYDSHEKSKNKYYVIANKIMNHTQIKSEDNSKLIFRSHENAIEINKYLNNHFLDVKQFVRDTVPMNTLYLTGTKDDSILKIEIL